jgi:hypothetical protein
MQSLSIRSTRRLAGAAMALALVVAAGCDDDDDDGVQPPVATEISITGGNNQNVTTGQAAANPLVVTVLDQFDDPMAGVSVAWAVASGGGTLSGATSTTNAQGQAQINYTGGATAGPATVTATVTGLTAVTFTLTLAAPAP